MLNTIIRKQTQITQIRHGPSYKQLEVKTNQANTNNVNKAWALLQTTGGKDEPNIVIGGNRTSQHETQNVKTHNKGLSPYNGRLSDFSFYIDSQISVHRKFKK